jgi:hypothetical protein
MLYDRENNQIKILKENYYVNGKQSIVDPEELKKFHSKYL